MPLQVKVMPKDIAMYTPMDDSRQSQIFNITVRLILHAIKPINIRAEVAIPIYIASDGRMDMLQNEMP
jgi:hypothetical protein